MKATAAETGASVQNIQQLVAGNYQVAFSLADTAADAVEGKGSFDGEKQPVQALSRIYPNYTQVIAKTGSGITSIADMRGKRVSTGSPGSGTEVIANRLLESAGLNPQTDVAAQRLDLTKTVDGMKDGSIDALFWSGGLPTPGITDLLTSARNDVTFIDITPQLAAMQETEFRLRGGRHPGGHLRAAGRRQDDRRGEHAAGARRPRRQPGVRADHDPVRAAACAGGRWSVRPRAVTLETARDTDPVPLNRGAEQALNDLNAPE